MPSVERNGLTLKTNEKKVGGNTKPDQAWLEAVADELHPPDESQRPAGFLYDIHYQWEGLNEELNLDFFESFRNVGPKTRPEDVRKCNGTAYVRDASGMYVVDADWERLTRPCLGRPGRGTVVCHSHGSRIPVVKEAAQRALAHASEVVALRLIGLTAPRDELQNEVAHKDRITAANSVLDRAGVKGDVTVEIKAPGFKAVLDKMFGDDSEEDEANAGT